MRTRNETIKKEILDCAIDQFAQKGYAAVNLAEIADELNISRAPLYYYFSNKAELYKAAVECCIEEQKAAYTEIFSKKTSFLDIVREDFIYCLKDKGLFSKVGQGGKDEPDISNLKNEFSQWIIDLKYQVFSEYQKKGEISKDTDLSELITFIYIYYYGVLMTKSNQYNVKGFNEKMLENSVDSFIEIIDKKYVDHR